MPALQSGARLCIECVTVDIEGTAFQHAICSRKGRDDMRRILIGLIAVLAGLAISIVTIGARPSFTQQPPKESKEQPTKVKLDTDSLDDKWGEVAFDHETHSVRKYNPDGASVTPCTFCHHTDQPKANLKAPLTTSERNVVLTADVLKDASATPVKACRGCHLQAGDE